jgi:acyl-CoA reductase-like NAD-dependent aldehyde dehydrogenase
MKSTEVEVVCPNLVDGIWVHSGASRRFERRNPADFNDVIGHVPLSSREDVDCAVAAAERALPIWRRTPAPVRGRILSKVARSLDDHLEEVATLLTREEGKLLAESRAEVRVAINALEYFASLGRRLAGESLPSERERHFVYTPREPLGVVGLITPWNFPVGVPIWKIAPALMCGNTVVWKPAKLTSFVSRKIAELFAISGLPQGVLNIVNGAGLEVGDALVEHPNVRALSFTSSSEVGRVICAKAAAGFKKVQCETGGKNPAIVFADANLDQAADRIVAGAFGSAGQRCTATSRVVVIEEIADLFANMLHDRAAGLRVGNGLNPTSTMGPIVDDSQFSRILEFVEGGKREGKLVFGGTRLSGGAYDNGFFMSPTIFDHVPSDSRLAREEIFGPVLVITRVRDFQEAVRVANDTVFGMAAGIYTKGLAQALSTAELLDCGIVHVNSSTTSSEIQVPFGGSKLTGLGPRECGSTAVDFYSELKAVYLDYSDTAGEG